MAMVLDALVSAVTSRLVDEGIKKIASVLGVKSETRKLQRSIESIRSVLVDAKSKKIEDKSINLWFAKLREVMCDVEDLLDDWQVEADRKVAAAGDISCSWIACLPSVPGLSRLIFRSEIATRIENINSNLEKLTSETSILQLLASQPNAEKKVSRYNSSRITDTCSFQLDSEIVGIDDDATDLVGRITGDSNRAHSLFAITGMGGIGKTTLSELLSSLRRLRVLDLQGTGIETLPDSLGALIHLRFFDVSNTKLRELPDSLGALIHLRFLNVSSTEIRELPDSLGALIHLRFFDVSRTKLTKLPDSIKSLKNLETLEAYCMHYLRSLPMGICELFNLRCLRVSGRLLEKMPNGLDNLKNLRILDCFVVNDCSSSNMKELKDLSQLTDLAINNLERVGSKEEAEEAAIEKKTSLECLVLNSEPPPLISDEDIKKIEEVFAGIKLPENLTDLRILCFFGKQLPVHMTSDHLRQLTHLQLFQCRSLTRLPSLGDMPKLQRLEIWYAKSVVEFGSEFLGSLKFPKLEELKLHGMKKLQRMFEVERGAFPCLVKLSISDCPKLNSLGEGLNHATCLKKLEVTFLENLKSIENPSSVENLPSLKIMKIGRCPALKDIRNVGELDLLDISDLEMKTLPRWLENITPPKKLFVEGSEELVLGIQQSVEDQNIMKKCIYAEVRTLHGSKCISYRKDPYSYNSNLTGSSGASSSVTIN